MSSSTLVKLTRSQQIQVCLLILPIVLISAQGSERYRCPPGGLTSGWIYEYESKCYQFILEEKSWEDAKRFCYANNGALLNTDTQSKHNFVVGILTNELGNEFTRNGFWLGLHDKDREGDWLWDEGPGRPDTPMGWSNWQTGEPNNLANQDCVYMRRGYGWRWVDVECTGIIGRRYSFACEYDMLPPSTTTTKATTRTSTSTSTTPRTTPITPTRPVVTTARTTTKITTIPTTARTTTKSTTTPTRTTAQITTLPTTTSSTTTLSTTTMKSTTSTPTSTTATTPTTTATTTATPPSTKIPTATLASTATVATTPTVTTKSVTSTTAMTTTLITETATSERPASSEIPATSTNPEAIVSATPALKTASTSTAALPTTTLAEDLQTTSSTIAPVTTATFTVEEITTTGELTTAIKTTTASPTEQMSHQTFMLSIAESPLVNAHEANASKADLTEAVNAPDSLASIDNVSTTAFLTTYELHEHTATTVGSSATDLISSSTLLEQLTHEEATPMKSTATLAETTTYELHEHMAATVGSSPPEIIPSNTLLEQFTHEEATPMKSTATLAKTSTYELLTSGYKHTLVEDRSKEALTTTESSFSAKSEIFITETQKDVLVGKEVDIATVEQTRDKESIKDDGSLLKISESGKIKADKDKSNNVYIYTGIASGVMLILLITVMVFVFVSRRKRTKLAETPTALTNPCFIDRESLAFDSTTDHWSGSGSFGVTFKISSQEAGKYPVGGTRRNNDISFIGTSTQQERCYDESCMNDSAQDNLLPFISDSQLRMQLSFLTDSQ